MPNIKTTFVYYYTDDSADKTKAGFGVINNQNPDGTYGLLVKLPDVDGLSFIPSASIGTGKGMFTSRDITIKF